MIECVTGVGRENMITMYYCNANCASLAVLREGELEKGGCKCFDPRLNGVDGSTKQPKSNLDCFKASLYTTLD